MVMEPVLELMSIAVSEDLLQTIDHLLESPFDYRIQFCMCSRFLHSGMLLRPQIPHHIHKHVSLLPSFEEQVTVKKTVVTSTSLIQAKSTGPEETIMKLTVQHRNGRVCDHVTVFLPQLHYNVFLAEKDLED